MSDIPQKARNILLIGAIGICFIILPRFLEEYFLHVVIQIFFFGYLGMAWNILGGYAGQFSFGHTVFFGVGAFTSTLLQIHAGVNPWIGMIMAGIAGLLLGLFIGSLCFRYGLRGHFFALAMLGVAEMFYLIAVEWMADRYPLGVVIPIKGNSFRDFQFTTKMPYYYIILLMMAAILYITYAIDGKRVGSYFKAIRENENSAEALGVNVFRYKLLAMAISSSLTAIGGTFYAQYYLFIDEESTFGVSNSIAILLGPILGGAGTVFGSLLGAGILECLSEATRSLLESYSGVHLMVYGAILIFIIIFLPRGILGGFQKAFRRLSKGR